MNNKNLPKGFENKVETESKFKDSTLSVSTAIKSSTESLILLNAVATTLSIVL